MASRAERLKNDIESVRQTYKEHATLKGLTWDEDECQLTYRWDSGDEQQCYALTVDPTSYPDGTTMMFEPFESFSKPIDQVLELLLQRYHKCSGEKTRLVSSDDSSSSLSDDDAEDPIHAEPVVCDELLADIARFKALHGDDSVTVRVLPSLPVAEVTLSWRPPLTRMTCVAWGLDPDVPVHVKLELNRVTYLRDAAPKKISLSMPGYGRLFTMRHQLTMIVLAFLTNNWSGLIAGLRRDGMAAVPPARAPTPPAPKSAEEAAPSEGRERRRKRCDSSDDEDGPAPACRTPPDVRKLESMGFTTRQACAALSISGGVLEAAVQCLMEDMEVVDVTADSTTHLSEAELYAMLAPKKGKAPAPRGAGAIEDFGHRHKKARVAQDELLARVDRSNGLLEMILSYLNIRAPHLNELCIICDQEHLFQVAMLKPAVCSRAVCCFAFQTLNVAADSGADVAVGTSIVDLLVCLILVAAKDPRHDLILDPFPAVAVEKMMVLDPNKKNIEQLREILRAFPKVSELANVSDFAMLQVLMDSRHPHSYPLLQWIISSNRSHMVLLPEADRIPSIRTPFQYLLLSSTPEKEARFQELKALYGSKFGYHGSPTANWHSILRNGLRNASGTKFQMHGAAAGKGIYISATAQYSLSYAYQGQKGYGGTSAIGGREATSETPRTFEEQFLDPDKLICMALCEVIKKDNVRNNGTIWVVPDEECVCTRFLFVWSDVKQVAVDTRNSEDAGFHAEVERAMRQQGIL